MKTTQFMRLSTYTWPKYRHSQPIRKATSKFNNFEPDDVEYVIENLAYLAMHYPWPSPSRSGSSGNYVAGYDGIRAARVYVALLLYAERFRRLQNFLSLNWLAIDVGMSNGNCVGDALEDLEREGLIEFIKGTRDRRSAKVEGGLLQGRPSTVTLIPQPIQGTWKLSSIPSPALEPFATGASGAPDWWVIAKVLTLSNEHGSMDFSPKEIVELTGMTDSRVRRSLESLNSKGLCIKNGRKYTFHHDLIHPDSNIGAWGEETRHRRKKKLEEIVEARRVSIDRKDLEESDMDSSKLADLPVQGHEEQVEPTGMTTGAEFRKLFGLNP